MGDTRAARDAWASVIKVFLSNEVHDRLHDASSAVGLPHPGALKLLMRLDAGDPQPMRALASDIGCDASYMTALVDALEGPGFVERRPAPGDRRVKLVCLTEEGEAARERAVAVLSEPPEAFRGLAAQDARTLARLLARVTEELPSI